MQWLGPWLTDSQFQQSVSAICAHPASHLGRNVLSISPEEFVCGQSHSLFFLFYFHSLPSLIQYYSSVSTLENGNGIEFLGCFEITEMYGGLLVSHSSVLFHFGGFVHRFYKQNVQDHKILFFSPEVDHHIALLVLVYFI